MQRKTGLVVFEAGLGQRNRSQSIARTFFGLSCREPSANIRPPKNPEAVAP